MNFFKTIMASMIGTIIAFFIAGFLFFLLIVVMIASGGNDDSPIVKSNSVLKLELNQAITERVGDNDRVFNPATFSSEGKLGLNRIVDDLKRAKTDDKIKGLYIEVGAFGAAPSTILDIRNAVLDFKESGKWVVAYGENYTQGGYYIASAADEVYMYPTGNFDWRGLHTELMFFKNMLEKLEIDAQVIRGPNNKFKSAVEPYMYDHMSDANREQIATFVGDIWNVMLDGISTSRNVSKERLNFAADSLTYRDVEVAVNDGLLDGLWYPDQVMKSMEEKLGLNNATESTEEEKDDKKEINFITLSDYHEKPDSKKGDSSIAIVYAVGAIESGEGDDETIGSDRIAKALKDARENKDVKAIVFRVSSPGGSALASDVIWRETELIKQSGKPLIVSMGDYAASGGYYISCSADRIFANPNTITGSIGVFGVIPNFQKFLNNKIGITMDTYKTNAHADLISVTKPLDEFEMETMQDIITDIYDDFTSKVAKGRNMTQAAVDSIGQGRVWSGEDALQIGLVDELGDLDAAIAYAAQQAGLETYNTIGYPKIEDPFQKLVEDITGQKREAVMKEILGEEFRFYQEFQNIRNIRGPQARMPFSLEIK
ncbi:MAG: signal peptide peptidase SppA [Flavobacteriales bacterium]